MLRAGTARAPTAAGRGLPALPSEICQGTASGFAAEGTVVIEVEEVEPGFDVLARSAEFFYFIGKKCQRFMVAIWRAVGVIFAPGGDFPGLGF